MRHRAVKPRTLLTVWVGALASLWTVGDLFGVPCYVPVGTLPAVDEAPLTHAIDVAVGPDGFVYVTDSATGWGWVKKYNAQTGRLVWKDSVMDGVGLDYCAGVAVGPGGCVYVGDNYNNRVVVYEDCEDHHNRLGWYGACREEGVGAWHEEGSGHTPITGDGPGMFYSVIGVAVSTEADVNYVYVSDHYNNRVQKLRVNASGPLLSFDRFIPEPGTGVQLYEMRYLGVHNGLVFVTDSPQDSYGLNIFTTDGALVKQCAEFDGGALGPGTYGLAVDSRGYVYIANGPNHWVGKYEFDAGADAISLLCDSRDGDWGVAGFNWPLGLAVGGSGRVYVAEPDMGFIRVFDPVNRPPVCICQPVEAEADLDCEAFVAPEEVDAGSYDPDGDPITLTLHPPGPYPLGETPVTLWVTDGESDPVSCAATITVVDDSAPYLLCSGDIVVGTDSGECGAAVDYEEPEASDNCDADVEVSCDPPSGSMFPVGETVVICTAVDDAGNAASCSFTVTVEDTEMPVIGANGEPIVLWPPNHKYVVVDLTDLVTDVWDNCNEPAIEDVRITQVSSDEPEDTIGNGDGNTEDDIVIGPDCQYVALRKERQGGGNGRVYTIHLSLYDEAGNQGRATAQAWVPHDMKDGAVDDGPAYEEIGCDAAPENGGGNAEEER